MCNRKALQPEQRYGRHGCSKRLSHPPAISSGTQHEHKEEKEWASVPGRKQGDHNRPENIRSMYKQTKGSRGFLTEAQEQHHHDAMHNVEPENPIGPTGITEVGRVHPNCNQRGDSQEDPGGSQPALDTADLTGRDRSPQSGKWTV